LYPITQISEFTKLLIDRLGFFAYLGLRIALAVLHLRLLGSHEEDEGVSCGFIALRELAHFRFQLLVLELARFAKRSIHILKLFDLE